MATRLTKSKPAGGRSSSNGRLLGRSFARSSSAKCQKGAGVEEDFTGNISGTEAVITDNFLTDGEPIDFCWGVVVLCTVCIIVTKEIIPNWLHTDHVSVRDDYLTKMVMSMMSFGKNVSVL